MDKLIISDSLKVGIQQLLLGDVTVTHCGYEVDGILANHLSVKQAGVEGAIPLIEYIDARITAMINAQHGIVPPTLTNRPILVQYGG